MAGAGGRLAVASACFGLAAALSSWNPLAAPFGLVVGLVTVVLAWRALRQGARRPFAVAGLALALLATGASALVLAMTAGVGREPKEKPVVEAPGEAETGKALDDAAARTREARERARSEQERREGGAAPARPPARKEAPPGRSLR